MNSVLHSRLKAIAARDLADRSISPGEADTLVALWEAAKEMAEHVTLNGGCHPECPVHDDLVAALARLEETP